MLNRPATKIELKLEEDITEYEDTMDLRKNHLNNISANKNEYEFELLTPESYKNNVYYHDSNAQFNIEHTPLTPDNKN
jgi:hypothetical protein